MCGQMLSVVANRDGSLSLNQKVLSNVRCMYDNAFWEGEKNWSGAWIEEDGAAVSTTWLKLVQIVYFTYALCNAIVSGYSKLSRRIIKLISNRCNRKERGDGGRDEVDGSDEDERRVTYEVEMYLRQLYLSFRAQSFIDEEGKMDDHYVGCRQQCLYGCVCFVVLFFDLYNNFDAIGMKNVDWLTSTVLNRSCGDLVDGALGENEA